MQYMSMGQCLLVMTFLGVLVRTKCREALKPEKLNSGAESCDPKS